MTSRKSRFQTKSPMSRSGKIRTRESQSVRTKQFEYSLPKYFHMKVLIMNSYGYLAPYHLARYVPDDALKTVE